MTLSNRPQPKVAIILVNYRGAAQTLACLQSLQHLTYPAAQIFVVENGSPDHSWYVLQAQARHVRLLRSEYNLGYSGGNNLAIREALLDPDITYIWLLNNDTQVDPYALTPLVNALEASPQTIAGSLILYPDGRFQHAGQRLEGPHGKLAYYTVEDVQANPVVEALTGCSMLIPRTVLETVGLLSEDYFLYWEDHDYCLRAKAQGVACRVVLASRVYHEAGASTGQNKPLVSYYYQRNRLMLVQRFFPEPLFQRLRGYTRLRLIRSRIKTWFKRSADVKQHHRAFELAVHDVEAGWTGPCPHSL